MSRLSMDFAINTEKTEPKTSSSRRQSTGSLAIQISEPNYLKASTGSCHDICKFGIRRASPDKPWSTVGRKDHGGRKASSSPKLMPMSPRQHVNELLTPKPLKTNAFGHQSSTSTNRNQAFSTSSSKIRESRNHEGKDIKTFKTTKNRSSIPLPSPKVPIKETRATKSSQKKASQSEIKNRAVEKNEMKKTNFENVPEKIIHVVKTDDENRNKGHESYKAPASITTLSPKQNQQLNSVADHNRRNTTRGARVIIAEEKDSSLEKLKLRSVKVVETENGNPGSKDGSLRRSVSDGKLIIKKTEDLVLMNSVIEERANTLVNMRKGTVEALVRAFESVITKAQDS